MNPVLVSGQDPSYSWSFPFHLLFTIHCLPSKPHFLTVLSDLSDLYPFFKPLHLTPTWMEKLNEMISHLKKKKKWIFLAASNTKKTLIKSVLMDFQCQRQAGITTDLLVITKKRNCTVSSSHFTLATAHFRLPEMGICWRDYVIHWTTGFKGWKETQKCFNYHLHADGFPISLKGLSFRTLYLISIGHSHSKWTPYCSPPQLTSISPVFLPPEIPSCHPNQEPWCQFFLLPYSLSLPNPTLLSFLVFLIPLIGFFISSFVCLPQIHSPGISLVVQWLRLCSSNGREPRFDPWSGNYIPHAVTKSSHAATKDPACHS